MSCFLRVSLFLGYAIQGISTNRVFCTLYKVDRNGNFVFKGFNNSKKKLPPVGLDLMLQIITGLGVQSAKNSNELSDDPLGSALHFGYTTYHIHNFQ